MAESKSFALVAATNLSGCAFLPRRGEIMMIRSWKDEHFLKRAYTIPSSVLVDINGAFLAYGHEAEELYKQETDYYKKSKMLLFRNLYTKLQEGKLNSSKALIASEDGTIRPAFEIFAHALRYIKEYLLDVFERLEEIDTKREDTEELLRWVIVLPNKEAVPFMQTVVEKGGYDLRKIRGNYLMATENEAVSVALQKPNIITFKDDKNAQLVKGTQYILLNCRDASVDIVAQKIMSETSVDSILTKTGPWGKDMVIRNLVRLIGEALGNNFVNRLQAELPQVWSEFIKNFEKWNLRMTEGVKLLVTFAIARLFADMNKGTQIDEYLQKGKCEGVSFNNGFICLHTSLVRRICEPVVNGIIEGTKSVLLDTKVRGVKYIVIIGEFSKYDILQEELTTFFNRDGLKVHIPNEQDLVVLKGAALYGHCK